MKGIRSKVLKLMILFVLVGATGAVSDDGSSTASHNFTHVTLSHKGGGWDPPEFEVTIHANGDVAWSGNPPNGLPKTGSKKIAPEDVKRIPAALKAAGWKNWQSKNPCRATDVEELAITIHWVGGSKSVEACDDDTSAPKGFLSICKMIDEIAGTAAKSK